MNKKEKVYTEFIGVKLTKEEHSLICKALGLKKKEKLSAKLREFILSKIQIEPIMEYRLTEDEGITGVYLYKSGTNEIEETTFFSSLGDAMDYIKKIGANKKED